MNCTTTIRHVGDVAVVDLIGRFTMDESPGRIRGAVASVLESGGRNILLNLAQVTLMDSAAGIGELIGSYTSATRQGAQLKLLRAGKHIDRVLHLTGLHTVFQIYDDEDAAVRSFREEGAQTRT